jgi:erythronate-4-phosphate dehydrogenase
MPFVQEAFSGLGDTVVLAGRSISADDLRDADILAIRSTTEVNEALLADSDIKFVGTATIGFNHMDIGYLDERGIAWCASPGCNANSVAEYVTSALLSLASRHGFTLADKTIGVIGIGNVGSRVVQNAHALGMRVLQNDPPRARTEGVTAEFLDLDQVLEGADIITLHVPLTKDGTDPTYHIVDDSFLRKLSPGTILVNSSRGAVVDTDLLVAAIDDGTVGHAVIDTWENEPAYSRTLLDIASLGTPHIAGYSFEGKVAGTLTVYRKACHFLGVEPEWTPASLMPVPATATLHIEASGREDQEVLWEIVSSIYNIENDDSALRDAATDDLDECARRFDALRNGYPVRREFPATKVTIEGGSPSLADTAAALGFKPLTLS